MACTPLTALHSPRAGWLRDSPQCVCHRSPWLDRNHPDPHGEQLRKLAFVFRAFAAMARTRSGCRVGVFFDYVSLPQKNIDGTDDRTDEHKARFSRALRGINAWYGCQYTFVLLVTTPLPAGHEYTNTQQYDGRGWCRAEKLMSAMVKDSFALIDLSKLRGDETSVVELVKQGTANRPAPITPDAFHRMLTSGVADGSIKFTCSGDTEVVARIYERAFLDEMSGAKVLAYQFLGWGDEQLTSLSAALVYAHDHGALEKCEGLYLGGNAFGEPGMRSLSEALAKGALPKLRRLFIDSPSAELRECCSSKGITL